MSEATVNAPLQRVEEHNAKIKSGQGKVQPGEELWFSPALGTDEAIAQGDFYMRRLEAVPAQYKKAEKPSLQLVQGEGQGSKHCLDSLEGVEVFLPPAWGREDNLNGPVLVLSQERTIEHPVHGNVHLPANTIIDCFYQRQFDEEQQRERRARD